MSFACPDDLPLVQAIPKRDFLVHQLAASDPEGYTDFMPSLMTEIGTLGIDYFFPPGFTLNFVPIQAPEPGATPAEIAAHAALVLVHELADYESPSQNLLLARDLNQKLTNWNLARLPDGTRPPGTVPFTAEDNAMLISVNSSCTIEENLRISGITLIGPFLVKLKNQITPQLSIALDAITKSDRLVPRRKNGILRKAILYLEIVCSGSADTYHPILYQ